MEPRTYKAETMLEALQLVQQDLGPEAIVVSARQTPLGPAWNAWKKSGVEVLAMPAVAQTAPAPAQAPLQTTAAPSGFKAQTLRRTADGLGVEFVENPARIEWVNEPAPKTAMPASQPDPLRWQPRRIERESETQPVPVRTTQSAPAPAFSRPIPVEDWSTSPELKKLVQQLSIQGLEEAFLERMLKQAAAAFTPATLQDPAACRKTFSQLLQAELRSQNGSLVREFDQVIFLVGASGSGKTSMAAKLALLCSTTFGRRVVWVCADTLRTGAIAEARSFTDALGLPLRLVYTPADLRKILSEGDPADLYLVDTPGFNPWDEEQVTQIGALLAEAPNRRSFLVGSATTREVDLRQAAAVLSPFNLNGVVITRMDETNTFGSIYNFGRKCQIPLSYFAYGRETAGYLQAADGARLVDALFGKVWR